MTPITTTAELAAFCDQLKGQPFIAVDTEFMRETTYWPKLCLIQAAAPTDAAIIDPLAEGLDLSPFLDLLRDPKIVKVFHAARQDVEIFNNLGAMPKPLFDTQIAGMAAGFGEQVAYDALVRQMLQDRARQGAAASPTGRAGRCRDAQLTYALADVTHLAALYPKLRERLEKEGRLAWVTDEMARPDRSGHLRHRSGERLEAAEARASSRAKYLAVFSAVAAWRERTAQTRDQPRGRILKDEAIDEIATQAADRRRRPSTACARCPRASPARAFGPDLLGRAEARRWRTRRPTRPSWSARPRPAGRPPARWSSC